MMPGIEPRVYIAHGWLGHPGQFRRLADHLSAEGFDPSVIGYPTLSAPFSTAVDTARRAIQAAPAPAFHCIGFSFGGLVMRALAAEPLPGLKSLLLIGTPNGGAPFADLLRRVAPTPALRQLSLESHPPPSGDIRVGCIAGARQGAIGYFLGERNDGRVTVRSALAVPHHDARVLPIGHRALPFSPETARLAVSFLREGHFGAS